MTLMVGDNMVVSMHYTLTDPQGNVLDSSESAEPLAYLHGANNIIPGLERGLIGKTVDDECQVTVAPEEGYGAVIPELVQSVDKAAFEGVESLEAGMAFEARSPEGEVQRVVITEINGDQVTVDGNHPLAGVTLNFDVKIVSVRDATAEELEHGHPH
ncbi:MAG: peptidylprolyl isomerase [Candidatus Thioglobus sp.]|nr:MAG: peptidylprolyl isomerase [Candidatus Thioglobus sp.]|tara:strand:- start:91 stop:561 length:471 start_codon:yes stop_codon:yes gene_type:complete